MLAVPFFTRLYCQRSLPVLACTPTTPPGSPSRLTYIGTPPTSALTGEAYPPAWPGFASGVFQTTSPVSAFRATIAACREHGVPITLPSSTSTDSQYPHPLTSPPKSLT